MTFLLKLMLAVGAVLVFGPWLIGLSEHLLSRYVRLAMRTIDRLFGGAP